MVQNQMNRYRGLKSASVLPYKYVFSKSNSQILYIPSITYELTNRQTQTIPQIPSIPQPHISSTTLTPQTPPQRHLDRQWHLRLRPHILHLRPIRQSHFHPLIPTSNSRHRRLLPLRLHCPALRPRCLLDRNHLLHRELTPSTHRASERPCPRSQRRHRQEWATL